MADTVTRYLPTAAGDGRAAHRATASHLSGPEEGDGDQADPGSESRHPRRTFGLRPMLFSLTRGLKASSA